MKSMARKKSANVLNKLLDKRGIEKVEDLSVEEQATFQKWRLVLSGDTVTIDSIKEFCAAQIKLIEGKCDGVTPLTTLQQACIHVYVSLLKTIEAPEAERESLEKYLTQIVNA